MAKIIQYWHSRDIPEEVNARIETVRQKNPEHEHILFDEESATSFIRTHFTSREQDAFSACAVPAMKCDFFRYCALYILGGTYIDADFFCLERLDPLISRVVRVELFHRLNQNIPNGFIIAQEPNHPLMRFAIDISTSNIETRLLGNNIWATTGPAIITTLSEIDRLGSYEAFLASLPYRLEIDREPFRLLGEIITTYCGDKIHDLVSAVVYRDIEDLHRYITHFPEPSYKYGDIHWTRWRGSIYN